MERILLNVGNDQREKVSKREVVACYIPSSLSRFDCRRIEEMGIPSG
jgi:hypothetical protein